MNFLNIIGTVNIKPDWANISGSVLKAGTPLSVTGVVANNGNALGLLAQEAHKGDTEVNVVYAGLVDANEVKASYGSSLADAAIAAMKGITFVNASGAAVVPSGLPDSSEASQGDVLTIGSSGPEWDTPSGGGGGGPQVLYMFMDGFPTFNTKADGTGDVVTVANAVTELLANPTAYCFADPSQPLAPAFASVTEYDITVTLSYVCSGSLVGEVVYINAEDPT